MSVQSDIKKLNVYVAKLEAQLADMRRVLSVILEKLPLEDGEREELASVLHVEAIEQEVAPPVIHYEKTIQQLLDESERKSGQ